MPEVPAPEVPEVPAPEVPEVPEVLAAHGASVSSSTAAADKKTAHKMPKSRCVIIFPKNARRRSSAT